MDQMLMEVEDFLVDSNSLPSHWRNKCPSSGSMWLQLADALRNGQVLCALINNLVPGAIDEDKIHKKRRLSDGGCKRNIGLFLSACRRSFGLEEAELFDPEDLVDFQNFGKIFVTLSILSKSEEAEERALEPFPSEEGLHSFLEDRRLKGDGEDGEESQEDIYESVDKELYEDRAGDFRLSTDEEDIYGAIGGIYDALCSYRGSNDLAPPIPPGLAQPVGDLINSEYAYVLTLRRIGEQFILPLTNFLNVEHRRIIFLEMENLAKIHGRFYEDLMEACKPSRGSARGSVASRIANAFIERRCEFGQSYATQVSNVSRALDLLNQMRRTNPLFNEQVVKCEVQARDGYFGPSGDTLPLDERLRLPICQFLKMHLLFHEILKTIDQDDEGRSDFQHAYNCLLSLNNFVDSVRGESEELRAGRILKEQLVLDHVRKEVEEHPLTYRLFFKSEIIVAESSRKSTTKVAFVLGSSVLVCGPKDGNTYRCEEFITLEDKCVIGGSSSDRAWMLLDAITGAAGKEFCCPDSAVAERMMSAVNRAIQWMNQRILPTFFRVKKHVFMPKDCGPGMPCQWCGDFIPGVTGRAMVCDLCGLRCHVACCTSDWTVCEGEEGERKKPSHDLPARVLDEIKTKPWFHDRFGQREQVTEVLGRPFVPRGTFVARLPGNRSGIAFSIKDSSGRLRHLRLAVVLHKKGGKHGGKMMSYCWSRDVIGFATVDGLVRWCQNNSLKWIFSELDFKFGQPLTMVMQGNKLAKLQPE